MIRTLVKSLREYKRSTILTPLFVIGETLLEALIPYVISLLINDIKAGVGLSVILSYAWKLIALSLVALLFGYLSGIYSAKASTGFSKNLRHDIFENIQKFSFSNIDKFSNASLVTRLTTDIQTIQMAFMMIIRMAVRAPLNIIFSFTMAYIMGGSMALIFLVVAPILFGGLFLIGRTVLPIFKKAFPKYDELNHSIEENIMGIRVVKSFVREDEEIKKFNTASEGIRTLFTKAERILALNNPLMAISIYTVVIFVMIIGSKRIITTSGQGLDIGQFATLLTYSFQILVSLMMLSMIFVMLTFCEESMKRVTEVLLEKSDLVSFKNAVRQVQDGSIDFNHVSFSYSKEANSNVLEDIDLHIKSGEVIGIIGGTGSSKSSLVQLIARLYDVNQGSVKVGGVDVRDYDIFSLREEVAMVLQKNVLFSGTIGDNIRWGNKEASLDEVKEVCHLACADEFIDQMPKGYDTWIEQGGNNISGGQKQRLCIARALLKKPKILILDDSTSAIDTKTDALIRKAMRTYLPETTKIIIAQRTSSVEDANRIIVLKDGCIDAIGTSEELLKNNAIYREVYLSQNKQETETVGKEAS